MKQYTITIAGLLLSGFAIAQQPDTKSGSAAPAPTTHSTDNNSTIQGASAVKEEVNTAAAPPAKSDYAEQYKGIAIAEMQRVGIPASIKLAQGILESSSGGSELAQNANNHFGVKCGSNWNGKSYKKKDDDYNDKGEKIESCFRKYANPEESFYDHSEFLRDPRKYYRYGFLFGLDKRDYRGWAKGLESAGYATEKGYGDKLIDLIEKYKLYQYDDPEIQAMNSGKMNDGNATGKKNKRGRKWRNQPEDEDNSIGGTNGKPAPIPPRVGRINDVKVVLAKQGETIDDIANVFRLKPERVADYNERRYTPGKPLDAGTRIFISEKRSKWRGRAKHHFVRDNQTMFEISQQYGIKLKDLLKKNGMVPGQEPESGERVRVRGRRSSDEQVRLRTNTTPTNNRPANNKPSTTVGDELFEIGGDQPNTTPNNKPSTGGSGQTNTPTKPNTPTGTKPSTSPGSGSLPNDPVPVTGGSQTTPSGAPVVTPPPINPPPAANQPGFHTVVKGDTLFSLSRKYNITVAKLKSLNGMTNDSIQLGQKLRVQ